MLVYTNPHAHTNTHIRTHTLYVHIRTATRMHTYSYTHIVSQLRQHVKYTRVGVGCTRMRHVCNAVQFVLRVCVNIWYLPPPPRAPVLVAIALMEHGMKYADAVEYIRE